MLWPFVIIAIRGYSTLPAASAPLFDAEEKVMPVGTGSYMRTLKAVSSAVCQSMYTWLPFAPPPAGVPSMMPAYPAVTGAVVYESVGSTFQLDADLSFKYTSTLAPFKSILMSV
jgi:hypothetical protein